MTGSAGTDGKGGLRVAFLFSLFALSVLASGKYYQIVLGFLRVALFFAAAGWLWVRGRDAMETPLYAAVVAGFCILSLGHAFSSVYVWVSLQHALSICLAAVLLGVAVRAFGPRSGPSALAAFLPVLAGLAVLEIALAAYQRATIGTGRPHGSFSNPMFLSEFLAIASLFFASGLLRDWVDGGKRRIAWGTGAVLFLAGALSLTGSRGVAVALVPALMVLVVSHIGLSRGVKVFLLIVPGLAVLGWHSVSRFFGPDVYNYGRWTFWRSALRVFESHPFGVGLGGYKYHWFSTQEPFLQAFRHFAKSAVTPHNEYLEILAGLGLPGLLLFLAVLALPIWYAVRGWNRIPDDRRWLAAGALAGLVLSGTNALFNFNLHEFGLVFTDALLLGILLASLPEGATGSRLTVPPILSKAGAAVALLAAVLSASLLAGTVALSAGESLVRDKKYDAAEAAFRAAYRLDPWRAAIPDALSALYYRRYLLAERSGGPAADGLLLGAIAWEGKAMERCPMEQGFPYRQANLFIEKYRRSRSRQDLMAVIALTDRMLRINPYLVEAMWMKTQALLQEGDAAEATAVLQRAVSVEPNFCRGYAKLAEVARGVDDLGAKAFDERAAACRESAKKRVLEDGERWLVSEPGASTRE